MRLLFFAGSAREGSYNKKLARLGRHVAEANGIDDPLRLVPGTPIVVPPLAVSHRGR